MTPPKHRWPKPIQRNSQHAFTVSELRGATLAGWAAWGEPTGMGGEWGRQGAEFIFSYLTILTSGLTPGGAGATPPPSLTISPEGLQLPLQVSMRRDLNRITIRKFVQYRYFLSSSETRMSNSDDDNDQRPRRLSAPCTPVPPASAPPSPAHRPPGCCQLRHLDHNDHLAIWIVIIMWLTHPLKVKRFLWSRRRKNTEPDPPIFISKTSTRSSKWISEGKERFKRGLIQTRRAYGQSILGQKNILQFFSSLIFNIWSSAPSLTNTRLVGNDRV